MTDKYLNAGLELPLVPSLSIFRRCLRGENRGPDTGTVQHRFGSAGDIPFLRVRRVDLDAAPVLNFGLDQFDQLLFFRIKNGLVEVRRIGD